MSRRVVFAICIFALAVPTFAATPISLKAGSTYPVPVVSPSQPETYGGSSETSVQVSFQSMTTLDSTQAYSDDLNGGGYITNAGTLGFIPAVMGGIQLPNGALITAIELQGCDNSATQDVQAWLASRDDPGSLGLIASVSTGTTQTPGCGHFRADITPVQVDNANITYLPVIRTNALDGSVTGTSLRIFYKLQVSPGPATATFADVPTTSGIYKFVEALAASGITAGCGNGNYCPSQAVTRGQMAVFLATALGLHFPN